MKIKKNNLSKNILISFCLLFIVLISMFYINFNNNNFKVYAGSRDDKISVGLYDGYTHNFIIEKSFDTDDSYDYILNYFKNNSYVANHTGYICIGLSLTDYSTLIVNGSSSVGTDRNLYLVYEIDKDYYINIGKNSVDTDDFYNKGYNAGKNSVDITTDNQQAIDDYLENNNLYTENDYNKYGEDKYNLGFNAGVKKAENDKSFGELMFSIIDAPFNVLKNAFDFEILGYNVSNLLTAVVSLILVGFVVKLFI